MNRRRFIRSAALASLATLAPLSALPQGAKSKNGAPAATAPPEPLFKVRPADPLTIQKIEILKARGATFLRTTTKEGRVGLAVCDGGVETYAPVLKKMIAPYFLGKDARDLEALIDGVYVHASNYKKTGIIFWSCVAWVEFSLLDLIGQACGKSIGGLFGPIVRTEVPIYISSTARETTPEQEVANFEKSLARRGGGAIKYKIGGRMSNNRDAAPGRSEKLIALAAKTFPNLVHYADANGSYDAPAAIHYGRLLEKHNVAFFEEPCPFEDFVATKAVADALTIPVAGGEQDVSFPKFQWMIENAAVQIVQPDIVYNGGFVRNLRLARLARQAGIPITLHSPETGLQAVYMLHWASCVPNIGPYQEYHIGNEPQEPWASVQVRVRDGKVAVPQGVGKAFEIEAAFLEKAEIV